MFIGHFCVKARTSSGKRATRGSVVEGLEGRKCPRPCLSSAAQGNTRLLMPLPWQLSNRLRSTLEPTLLSVADWSTSYSDLKIYALTCTVGFDP